MRENRFHVKIDAMCTIENRESQIKCRIESKHTTNLKKKNKTNLKENQIQTENLNHITH